MIPFGKKSAKLSKKGVYKNLYESRKKLKSLVKFRSLVPTPTRASISSSVNALTQEFLQELTNSNRDLDKYKSMARIDPTVRACLELKAVRASNSFGRYTHHDSNTEKWVASNFENMRGSLPHAVGRLSGSAMNYGFAVAEVQKSTRYPGARKEWRLQNLNILDPTRVTFEGQDGEIHFVRYLNRKGESKLIDYRNVIHIVNGMALTLDDDESSNVYGDPESRTAYKYHKAKQAILSEMMIAAKTSATGIWVGKADSNKTVQVVDGNGKALLNADGSPRTENSLTSMLRQLQHIENNSAIVTDIDNQLTPLFGNTGEGMWTTALNVLDKGIKMAYGVPELIFSEGSGSLGVNGLGQQHKSILDSQIESLVVQVQDQIIEKIVRPLLLFNFSQVEDFGKFKIDPELDAQTLGLRINNFVAATSAQIIPANDLRVQNAVYESLGLSTITQEDKEVIQKEALMKTYLENQVFAGTNPETGEAPPAEEAPA
jgi:hypothetical protein